MTNQDQTQTQSNTGGATNSAPQTQAVKITLASGRFSRTIHHSWLFSIRENGWAHGHCYRGLDPGCDYYVLPGEYLVFSLSGYHDRRGATLSIDELVVRQDGNTWHGKTLFNIDLPYEYYEKICNDPTAPEVIRDFLSGRPLTYHSVSNNAPSKTYATPIDFAAIRYYFSQLVVER